MAAIIDLKKNPPKDKRTLTKMNMINYVKTYGTAEDKEWFKGICSKNQIVRTNNLTGKDANTYNWNVIREGFAKKFFPEASKAKKVKAKAKSKTKSFNDLLEEL